MKIASSIFITIILWSFSLLLTNCKKDKCPNEILADIRTRQGDTLTCEIMPNSSVRLRNRFINDGVTNINADESCKCVAVNTTNEHVSRWNIYYTAQLDFNGNIDSLIASMEEYTSLDVVKAPLVACNEDSTALQIQFNNSGTYIIQNNLDANNGTPERDELNNIQGSQKTKLGLASAQRTKHLDNNYAFAVIHIENRPKAENGKPTFLILNYN